MATKNEINVMTPWAVSRLRAVARVVELVGEHPDEGMVQVYNGSMLEGATYPAIIVRFMSGQYLGGSNGRRIVVRARYDVFATDQTSSYGGSLGELSDLILATLEMNYNQHYVGDGSWMIGCRAVAPYQAERYENEQPIKMQGTTFQLECRAVK